MWSSGYYGYLSDYVASWLILISLIVHAWCFFRFVKRDRHPRLTLVIGNGLLTLCLLGVVAMGAEIYLRFVSTATDSYGATMTSKRWSIAYARVNSLAHRDHEWNDRKPAGVRRIAFVGDSFVYGWGIDDPENRFSNLIQKRFDARNPGAVEVMNVAWAGWDSREEAKAIVRMITDFAVDEIVLCYLPNDIESILPVTKEFDPQKPPRPKWIRVQCSFLLDYLYYRVYARWVPSVSNYFDWLADGFANDETWRSHQTDLGGIITDCRSRGVTLRVALLPFLRTTGTKFDAPRIHARLKDFFTLNNVPVVDLLPAIHGYETKDLIVNPHDHHPNERSNALFAETIWSAFFLK